MVEDKVYRCGAKGRVGGAAWEPGGEDVGRKSVFRGSAGRDGGTMWERCGGIVGAAGSARQCFGPGFRRFWVLPFKI